MKFAELSVGQVVQTEPYHLSEEALLAFAGEYDPQWFHVDATKAASGPFAGLIASGWQTCAIAMRLAVDHVLAGSEAFASPGVTNVQWRHPVRAGDDLRLRALMTEVRRSSSKPHLGVLHWHWTLLNQHDQVVLEVDATSLYHLSPA
jgi:acyl dehydratase